MSADKKKKVLEDVMRLVAESEHDIDSETRRAKYKSFLKAHKIGDDTLFTNNQSRKRIIDDPSNICAVVIECTKSRSVQKPNPFADFRERFHTVRSKRSTGGTCGNR
jgi:hypothetical protein